MTRFTADAKGTARGGVAGYTKKDLRKNMEKYIQTGVHPDIAAAQEKARRDAITPLPDHDPNREFIFFDLALGSEALGRLVVELFTDHVSVASNHLKQRTLPGSKTRLEGAVILKLQRRFAVWFGKNPAASEGMRLHPNSRLRHIAAGAVSISLSGDEVCIALGRSLQLDTSYQVVGRVHKGLDVLEKLDDVKTDNTDVPLQRLTIAKCGVTNAAGTYEELDVAVDDGLPKDPVARLAAQSQGARQAVMHALAVGLGQKRKAEDDDSKAEPGSKDSKQGAGKKPPGKKAAYMNDLLGGADSDSSDDDDSDEADK